MFVKYLCRCEKRKLSFSEYFLMCHLSIYLYGIANKLRLSLVCSKKKP